MRFLHSLPVVITIGVLCLQLIGEFCYACNVVTQNMSSLDGRQALHYKLNFFCIHFYLLINYIYIQTHKTEQLFVVIANDECNDDA